MKELKHSLTLIIMAILLHSCDLVYKNNNSFGRSETKSEAINNGSEVIQYLPNFTKFDLIDGTKLIIDTAWTEESFSYQNGKREYDTSWGYIFNVPYEKGNPENFTFNFKLLDEKNQMFTNGLSKDKCSLRPIELKDKIQIIMKQKNPKKGVGWKSPIFTDTIEFTRIN